MARGQGKKSWERNVTLIWSFCPVMKTTEAIFMIGRNMCGHSYLWFHVYISQQITREREHKLFIKAFTKHTWLFWSRNSSEGGRWGTITQSLCKWLAPSSGYLNSLPVDPKWHFGGKNLWEKNNWNFSGGAGDDSNFNVLIYRAPPLPGVLWQQS